MARVVTTPDGVALHVVELGPADAPVLLALHGGPAAHHDYLLPAFAHLAAHRRLVLYDQRGGGRSRTGPGVDLSWPRHVEDAATVLDAVGAARADVIGYSFGGLLALLLAALSPARVDRLVLASAVPPWHGWRHALERRLAQARRTPWQIAEREALERSGLREAMPEEHRRRRFVLQIAGYFADPRLAHGVTPFLQQAQAAKALHESLGDYDFRDRLAAVDGERTLVVHGDADPLDPELARENARLLGARFELLPGCGHVPFVEAAERFFAILRGFLGDKP